MLLALFGRTNVDLRADPGKDSDVDTSTLGPAVGSNVDPDVELNLDSNVDCNVDPGEDPNVDTNTLDPAVVPDVDPNVDPNGP